MCGKVWWSVFHCGRSDNPLQHRVLRRTGRTWRWEKQCCWFQVLSCHCLKASKLPASSLSDTKPTAAFVAWQHGRSIGTGCLHFCFLLKVKTLRDSGEGGAMSCLWFVPISEAAGWVTDVWRRHSDVVSCIVFTVTFIEMSWVESTCGKLDSLDIAEMTATDFRGAGDQEEGPPQRWTYTSAKHIQAPLTSDLLRPHFITSNAIASDLKRYFMITSPHIISYIQRKKPKHDRVWGDSRVSVDYVTS